MQFSPFAFVARQIVQIHDGFEEINGFPGVIGAVDGCHIGIRTSSSHPDAYLNWLRYHSIILQVFCFSNFYQLACHLSSGMYHLNFGTGHLLL